MKSFEKIRTTLIHHKEEIQKVYNVQEIGIFGSFIRGEELEDSDVDILVDISTEYQTFRNYMGLKSYLERILGEQVDLVLKDSVRKELKKKIFKEVVSV